MKNTLLLILLFPFALYSQDRPTRFLFEDFKETPAEIPITQGHLTSAALELGLHGPGKGVIKKSNHEKPLDDPFYVWSGLCEGNWAVSLRHQSSNVDLSRQGKIRWRSKQSGFRNLHVILKLGDGGWIVSEAVDGPSSDWRVREINLADLEWRILDIENILELKAISDPDLSNVEAIGWTDLMRGGGSIACSRVDWIEVDGFAVQRK